MAIQAPRDPLSRMVDKDGRCTPEWYQWFVEVSRVLTPPASTVAELPPASVAGAGARRFVTDAANPPNFLTTVSGGGPNTVPVISDGTNWLIG
jgi:hypothetical protein